MRPYRYVLGQYAAADADAVATAQTVAAGVPFALNGVMGGALDVPRTLLFTFAGNETGNRFSIKGKGPKGNLIFDTVAGNNASTVECRALFAEVLEIVAERACANDVEVGTVDTVPTPWVPLDHDRPEFNVGLNAVVVGEFDAGGYEIQAYQGVLASQSHVWDRFDIVHPIDPALAMNITEGGTVAEESSFGQMVKPATAVRLRCTEALGAGESITFEVLQGN